MSHAQRMRKSLGEASTPGSARKRGRPTAKATLAAMGPKKGGKRASTGGKRVSSGRAIERELGHKYTPNKIRQVDDGWMLI